MDTISRENSSMLPVGGIIVGAIGLLLGGLALVQVSKVNKTVAEHQVKVDKVDGIEAQVTAASSAADKAKSDINALQRSMQSAVDQMASMISEVSGKVTKMEEAAKKPAPVTKAGGGGPVVAGPGEYIVKAGDTFSKIAAAQGVKAADIATVNPGVESGKLKVGQKIKLPKK